MSLSTRIPALCAAATLLLSASADAGEKLVIEAGRIITQAGEDILDGVIVIEDGRIVAIGKQGEVEKPLLAPVYGGPEYVAFPGYVEAHSNRGIDRPNENIDVAPFLDIRDSVDPVSFYFEDCLRWGITTINVQQGPFCVIGGRGLIVRPVGMTVEEMTVRGDFGLKLSLAPKPGKSPATQMQIMRRAFDDLRTYLEQLVREKKAGDDRARREALYQGRNLEGENAKGRAMEGSAWKVAGLELIPRGEIDEKQEPLLQLVEGKRVAFLHCGAPMDVGRALDLARTNGFLARSTLVITGSCWKAADLIAEAGVPVVLLPPMLYVEVDPLTGKDVETFVPKILAEKGIRFALSSENQSNNSLWYQAAIAVGQGLDRQAALDAVTKTPAEILGLGKRLGSLEVGKDGNVLLLTGDPLSVRSRIHQVVIEGKLAYDYKLDVRNKHLLEGQEPHGAQPLQTAEQKAKEEQKAKDEKDGHEQAKTKGEEHKDKKEQD